MEDNDPTEYLTILCRSTDRQFLHIQKNLNALELWYDQSGGSGLYIYLLLKFERGQNESEKNKKRGKYNWKERLSCLVEKIPKEYQTME